MFDRNREETYNRSGTYAEGIEKEYRRLAEKGKKNEKSKQGYLPFTAAGDGHVLDPGRKTFEGSGSGACHTVYLSEDRGIGNADYHYFLQAEDRIEGAVLSWETAEGTRTAEAVEVVDGYAAFLMQEAVEESSLFSLTVEQDGQSYLLDAKAFRQEADTVPLEADGEEEELPVAETAEEIRNVLGEAEGEALAAGTEQVLSLGELPGTSLNKTDGDVVVVLDPGHGGSDAGAWRTWNGRTYIEKEINLKIAQYTKQELETYEGVRVYMTRDTDVYLTLDERVDYAASVGATVLVSQHINSTPENETTAEGAEVMVSRGIIVRPRPKRQPGSPGRFWRSWRASAFPTEILYTGSQRQGIRIPTRSRRTITGLCVSAFWQDFRE